MRPLWVLCSDKDDPLHRRIHSCKEIEWQLIANLPQRGTSSGVPRVEHESSPRLSLGF